MHIRHKLEVSTDKIKTTWSVIRQETGKYHVKDQENISIKEDGELISNPKQVAEEFNIFFINIASKLTEKLPTQSDHLQCLYNVSFLSESSFFIQPTNGEEVAAIVRNLKNKKSCGWDHIPLFIIKQKYRSVERHSGCNFQPFI